MLDLLRAIWQDIREPQLTVSALTFYRGTGRLPHQDDLERSNCSEAGKVGHFDCGWSHEHRKPKFMLPHTIR